MSVFRLIDDALIDKVAQPMVNAASRYLGLSRYTLARAFLWGSFLFGFVSPSLHDGHLLIAASGPAALVPSFFLWVIIDYLFIVRYRKKDEGKHGAMPSARIERLRSRTIFTTVAALNLTLSFHSIATTLPFTSANMILMLYDFASDAVFLFALYIPACQAGPPRKTFQLPKLSMMILGPKATAAGAA